MAAKSETLKIGEVFGRLTVTGGPIRKGRYLHVPVLCSCGAVALPEQNNLRRGKISSCGCLNRELVGARSKTHGLRSNSVYPVWNAMKQRCQNPRDKGYENYGGRGIDVCEKWQTFEGFIEDMGLPPFKGAMLDRRDNDKGYNKDNCRWSTRKEQNSNTRKNVLYLYNGQQLSLRAIAEQAKINLNTLTNRVYKYGMSAQEAADLPVIKPEDSGAMAGNPLFTEVGKRQDGKHLYIKETK